MKAFNSVNEILDFAIGEEEGAAEFYTQMANKMEKPWMKKVFTDFAAEEMGHKAKLLKVKEGKFLMPVEEKVLDLKIGDYLVDVEASADMSYQDALITAMKKEKEAFRMYSDLASAADSEDLRNTFLTLAQEEARHKLRFEVEYDDFILKEG